MAANTKSVSAFPVSPEPFDVQKRIQELGGLLDPKNPGYQPKKHHINISATIKLYEDGEIDGYKNVFIIDGELVPEEDIMNGKAWDILKRGTPRWFEGMHYQYAQKFSYGYGPFAPCFHVFNVLFTAALCKGAL